MGSQGCVGTGSGHPLCPRSPGPALGLGFSSSGYPEPTSLWKNFTEQGWGGKQMISCFLMTPSSVSAGATGRMGPSAPHSATAGPERRQPGEGTLHRLQSSGADRDRHRLLGARQCRGLELQPEAPVRVPAAAREPRASPAPLGALGGCQDADGRCPGTGIATSAHFPVTAWLSPSVCRQCCPGSGVCRVPVWWLLEPAVPSGAGASPVLRLPEPGGAGVVQTAPGRGRRWVQPIQTAQKSAGTAPASTSAPGARPHPLALC